MASRSGSTSTSTSPNLDSVIEPALQKLLKEVSGLSGVVLSSIDSIGFGQAWKDEEANAFVATMFPFVTEQISKLQWGSIKSLTASFEKATLVHVNISPLMLTFVGSAEMDVDAITSEDTISRLEQGFKPLQSVCR